MATIGRFQIKRELGRGGMAIVYLAFDPRFNRDVAIKVLPREFLYDPQFRARFEREAQVIAALEDPAIVPVYDFGEEAEQPYLVMRYMAGGSLGDRLARGPLALPEVVHLLARLAPALDKAHRAGIVHRDLKPANILFDRDNNPYIADFGIAKLLESSGTFTSTGIIGTPAYMSSEQVEGQVTLDGRSDVYSLGIMLYELLAGQPPYRADTPMSLALMHLRMPVPHVRQAVPGVALAVDQVVATALAKDRNQRYPTAGALAAALARALDAKAPATIPTPPPRAASRPPASPPASRGVPTPARRPRGTALLLGLVGVLAVAVVLFVATRGNDRNGQSTSTAVAMAGLPTANAPTVALPATQASVSPTQAAARPSETPAPATDTPILPADAPSLSTATAALAISTPLPPTATPIPPSATPLPFTPTPQPDAVVNTPNANLRAGPGTDYDRLGSYAAGTVLTVTGKTATGDWIQVQAPDGKTGWMADSVLQVNTNLGQVAVAAAPPTPTRSAVPAGDMVFVPAGEFTMGSPDGEGLGRERPEHTVYLDAFYIYTTEVTAAQYRRCVEGGGCSEPMTGSRCTYGDGAKADHPINCVSWKQAQAYCAWAGRRLPTEAEWEKAARGSDGRIYPWGNEEPDCGRLNYGFCVGSTAPVGSYPAGVSPYGALDMAGNVSEWVADWYDRGYYAQSRRENPSGRPTASSSHLTTARTTWVCDVPARDAGMLDSGMLECGNGESPERGVPLSGGRGIGLTPSATAQGITS